MKEVHIKCNSKGVILTTDLIQNETLGVVLINDHNLPIARYQFDTERIKDGIRYMSNNCRVYFNVEPSMISELVPR